MLRIDKAILDTSEAICDNIDQMEYLNRGLLSQNILGQLRNLVEYIAMKEFAGEDDIDPNDYELRVEALKHIKSISKLKHLSGFHNLLKISVSHYTFDKDGSERLMLKYYSYLIKIKDFVKTQYNINILHNLDKFPLNTDSELNEYYSEIAEIIDKPSKESEKIIYDDRYYIHKIKPFIIFIK